MFKRSKQAMVVIICISIIFYFDRFPAFADSGGEPSLIHEALKTVSTGDRTTIETRVHNPQSVKSIDLYFKNSTQSDFVYVPMNSEVSEMSTVENLKTLGSDYEQFQGTLPALSATADAVEYCFVVTTTDGVVFRTNSYFPAVEKGAGLEAATHTAMTVYSPIPKTRISGYDDQVNVVTKLSDVPGVAAGLYPSISNITEYGTYTYIGVKVPDGSLPWSTTAIVAGTAAVVATVGLVAVMAGGGGGSGDSSSSSSSSSFTSSQLVGTYAVYDPSVHNWEGVWTLSSGGSLRYTEQIDGNWSSGSGSWSFSESNQVLTVHANYRGGMSGRISGSSPKIFTLSGSWLSGGSVSATFSRGG